MLRVLFTVNFHFWVVKTILLTNLRVFVLSGWSSVTDSSGAYLIDRSPEYFEPLLNFLRHSKLILNEGINPQGQR